MLLSNPRSNFIPFFSLPPFVLQERRWERRREYLDRRSVSMFETDNTDVRITRLKTRVRSFYFPPIAGITLAWKVGKRRNASPVTVRWALLLSLFRERKRDLWIPPLKNRQFYTIRAQFLRYHFRLYIFLLSISVCKSIFQVLEGGMERGGKTRDRLQDTSRDDKFTIQI